MAPDRTIRQAGPSKSPETLLELRKDGTVSKMRSHAGNVPLLPQTKACPHCPAKFTRITHLNRHLRTHSDERVYHCDTCGTAQFTRSDLLSRHKKSCDDPLQGTRSRRKSCQSCATSKTKCDMLTPCGKCKDRGKECVYAPKINLGRAKGKGTSLDSSLVTATTQLDDSSQDLATLLGQSDLNLVPVDSHLSSVFANTSDIFDHFFNDIFSQLPSVVETQLDDDSLMWVTGFATDIPQCMESSRSRLSLPTECGVVDGSNQQIDQSGLFSQAHWTDAYPKSKAQEGYMYLFFSAFLVQMPMIHVHTWATEGKPTVVVSAMAACGALFVKTRAASEFILETRAAARDVLVAEFAKKPVDNREQGLLTVAVVLLQTIGLFHHHPNERTSSALYHSLLVRMIRQTEAIKQSAQWIPPSLEAVSLDAAWRSWAAHETTKRGILLSYLHDCCHSIFLALPPSYDSSELNLNLFCEPQLWDASTATEWYNILQRPSAYGPTHNRLAGTNLQRVLAYMGETRRVLTPVPLNPVSHFMIIHVILRRIFSVCLEDRLPTGTGMTGLTHEDALSEIHQLQYCLHNWLNSWNQSPDTPFFGKRPSLMENAIPYYWLGQIAILAYQEGLPPFVPGAPDIMDARFQLVKHWLKRIVLFLQSSPSGGTEFWNELMLLRLQTGEAKSDNGDDGDGDGLLGFFPED